MQMGQSPTPNVKNTYPNGNFLAKANIRVVCRSLRVIFSLIAKLSKCFFTSKTLAYSSFIRLDLASVLGSCEK